MILVNGKNQGTVSASDRGFMYGDGVFETIAIKNGKPQLMDRHIKRLEYGCQVLGINLPPISLIEDEARQLYSGQKQAVLKIIITRGEGSRGYKTEHHVSPTRVVILSSWPEHIESYRKGIRLRYCQTRIAKNPSLAGIKHLNRLEQVLARQEWDSEFDEGLMKTMDNKIIEGTMSNLFIVKNNVLLTPDLEECGINGVMRSYIIDLADKHGIELSITTLHEDDLADADEIFICNSLMGICPVISLNEIKYKNGPITKTLINMLHQ